MKTKFEVKKIKDIKADVTASVTFEDQVDQKLHWLNTLYKGSLDSLIETKDFKGTANSAIISYINGDIKSKRLMVMGLGLSKEVTLNKIRNAYASSAKKLMALKLTSVAFEVPDLAFIKSLINASHYEIMQAICEGIFLTQYNTNKYYSNKITSLSKK
jgi:leucyl aminopeptidase